MYTGSAIQHHYLNWIQQPGQKGIPDRINGHVSESSSNIGCGLSRRGMSSIGSTCPRQTTHEWIPHWLSTQICGLDWPSAQLCSYPTTNHTCSGVWLWWRYLNELFWISLTIKSKVILYMITRQSPSFYKYRNHTY